MNRCWADIARKQLHGDQAEIASLYLDGPEAREYRPLDVQRAFQALGIDVDLPEVRTHRASKCSCYDQDDDT